MKRSHLTSRGLLIATALSIGGLPLYFAAPAYAQSEKAMASFQFKEVDGKSLALWEGERPVLVYNFGQMNLPEIPAAGTRSSYVHPIYGLDGEVLTDDFPKDHYHHHGLFWGWPHVKIGDREYDLWKMRGIRINFQRWLAKEVNADGAKLGVENGWFVGDKQVMKEAVWMQVHPASATGRNIDITMKWTPIGEPITLGGAESKSYGGVSLRYAPRTETRITVPTGRASDDLLITKLPWADLSAKFEGAPDASGAALFVDPNHRDYPPEWMARDYGLLAIGWPGVTPKTMPAGETVTCNYRLWIHRGATDAAEIQRSYDAYRDSIAERHESP